MELNGTSAVVTGGASGLGESTARLLTKNGVKVVLADLQDDKGEPLAKELGGTFVKTDVTNTDQIIAAVEAAKELGPLWSLVNCAGIGWATRTIGKDGQYSSAHDIDMYRRVIEINLIGTFNCIRIAATAMSQNEPNEDGERGAVVNTASVAAEDGQIGQAAYSSSKGGVVGMTLPVARDLAAVGVRVNTILPGLTELFAAIGGDLPSAVAVVTEVGGALSHAAVVAREFGVPCVVGTGIALSTLTDGELVEVDGSAGVVRRLSA